MKPPQTLLEEATEEEEEDAAGGIDSSAHPEPGPAVSRPVRPVSGLTKVSVLTFSPAKGEGRGDLFVLCELCEVAAGVCTFSYNPSLAPPLLCEKVGGGG